MKCRTWMIRRVPMLVCPSCLLRSIVRTQQARPGRDASRMQQHGESVDRVLNDPQPCWRQPWELRCPCIDYQIYATSVPCSCSNLASLGLASTSLTSTRISNLCELELLSLPVAVKVKAAATWPAILALFDDSDCVNISASFRAFWMCSNVSMMSTWIGTGWFYFSSLI